jgi:SOS-response transcriptional repressor LexA
MIGRAIRDARTRKGLTQAELAEAVGLTRQHVNNIEQDRGDVPLRTAVKIAKALGMSNLAIDEGLALRRTDLDAIDSIANQILKDASRLRDAVTQTRDDRGLVRQFPRAAGKKSPPRRNLLEEPPADAPFRPVRIEVEEEVPVTIVGYVAAGAPIDLLNETHGEFLMVPQSEAPTDPRWVALQARGESMIEFGIYDGDLVYVEPRRGGVAASGEIVIGWLNDGLVIKEWSRKNGVRSLISWNADYPPRVIMKDDVWELQAIVRKTVPRAIRGREFKPKPVPKISG